MPVADHRDKRIVSFTSLQSIFCIDNSGKTFDKFEQHWRVLAPQFEIFDKIGANFDQPISSPTFRSDHVIVCFLPLSNEDVLVSEI
jgi:hypothetical protein